MTDNTRKDSVTNVVNLRDLAKSDVMIGAMIDGKYKIVRRLGDGGMGEVYKGTHVTLGKRVAIKFIHLDLSTDSEVMERFNREARMMAQVEHQNVAAIIDTGCTTSGTVVETGRKSDGILYQVIEFLDGRDLQKKIYGKSFGYNYVIEVISEILSGLGAIHEAGIIHRDIKPENVFVCHENTDREHVKILDFGISKAAASKEKRLTQTGIIVGTPGYMSPEQARADELDERSDLWAVGVIMFEMLTGRFPFRGHSPMEIVTSLLVNAVPSPCHFNPEIPPNLEQIVLTALAKERKERYRSASDFLRDLEIFSEGLELDEYETDGDVSEQNPTDRDNEEAPVTISHGADTIRSETDPEGEVTTIYNEGEEEPEVQRDLRVPIAIIVSVVLILGMIFGVWTTGAFSDEIPVIQVNPTDSDTQLAGKSNQEPTPPSPSKNADASPVIPADVQLSPETLVKNQSPPPVSPLTKTKTTRPPAKAPQPPEPPDASATTEPPPPTPPIVVPPRPPQQKARPWLDDRPPRRDSGAKVWLD